MNSFARFFARTAAPALALLMLAASSSFAQPARTAFDDYIAKPDPAYAWKLASTIEGQGYKAYVIDLTSQNWLTDKEVDRTLWKHWLTIVKPEKVEHNKGFLMIGGGSNGGEPPKSADLLAVSLALGTNSVVANLGQVPNQPLTFIQTDQKPRKEDDLIAYAWDQFLRGGRPEWLPRFAMAKSAVRAMDAIQEFMASPEGGEIKIDQFVVAGGSKRGWTTWMTAVADEKRVIAIVPIVIDMLNLYPSFIHHFRALGFWAPAVGDYVNHGIMAWQGTAPYQKLIDTVDPFSYRHRLTLPKYIVNAGGDQFFLPDSSQFYFDDLQGEKYLRYVPNGDHGLGGTDAREGVEAYYYSILHNTPRPKFDWKINSDKSITVRPVDMPEQVNLWQATNPETRDFRVDKIGRVYASTPLTPASDGSYKVRVDDPATGWTAFFVELVYKNGSRYPMKFTTGVSVVPDKLPFEAPPLSTIAGGGDGGVN